MLPADIENRIYDILVQFNKNELIELIIISLENFDNPHDTSKALKFISDCQEYLSEKIIDNSKKELDTNTAYEFNTELHFCSKLKLKQLIHLLLDELLNPENKKELVIELTNKLREFRARNYETLYKC